MRFTANFYQKKLPNVLSNVVGHGIIVYHGDRRSGARLRKGGKTMLEFLTKPLFDLGGFTVLVWHVAAVAAALILLIVIIAVCASASRKKKAFS